MVGSIIAPTNAREFRTLMMVITVVFFAILVGGVVLLLVFGEEVFLDTFGAGVVTVGGVDQWSRPESSATISPQEAPRRRSPAADVLLSE